jgi:hypothetical protein
MIILLLQGPDIHDDIWVNFLECVDISQGGWKRYTSPIKILKVKPPHRRLTELIPPKLFWKRVVEPAITHTVLETEVVSLLLDPWLGGIVNVDQAMLGLDRIRGGNERPTTSGGVLVDTDRDCIHAHHFYMLIMIRPFVYIII